MGGTPDVTVSARTAQGRGSRRSTSAAIPRPAPASLPATLSASPTGSGPPAPGRGEARSARAAVVNPRPDDGLRADRGPAAAVLVRVEPAPAVLRPPPDA